MTKKTNTGSDVLAFANRAKKLADKIRRHLDEQQVSVLGNARVSSHIGDRVHGYGLTPLKDNELKSVYALFAWVANEQKAAEETVRAMTETRFNVETVTDLRQKDYDEVIKFLVDLRIDEMRH